MTKKLTIIFLSFYCLMLNAATFSVRDFGAAGDGKALDSPAFNKAIEAASLQPGSTVLVPAGEYKCFTIRLRSNVSIRFEEGAVLKAAHYSDGPGYDAPEDNPWWKYQDFGHSHWRNSLIWGDGVRNVSIEGPGFIDGSLLSNGITQRKAATSIALDFTLVEGAGNKVIGLRNCENIRLSGFTVLRGGHFCILATGVNNLYIGNLTLDSQRDGVDIDCCKGVTVENCRINTPWDDAIVMKSSYALGSYIFCEDITIRNCHISGYDAGSLISGELLPVIPSAAHPNPSVRSSGRIKFGTESSGGFRNISVSDCLLEYCGGLHVESTDGGIVENISFRNITLDRCADAPVFVMIGSRLRSPEGRAVGSISNVRFDGIVSRNARGEYGLIITGFKDNHVRDVSLSNSVFHSAGGFSPEMARSEVLEVHGEYPDPKTFGTMPSKGLYLRHVRGFTMDNVSFEFEKEDTRPLFIREDAEEVQYSKY